MIDTNNLLTVNEVAKQLKLTVPSVKLLIKNDQLKAKQSGNQWLISVKNLNEYIKINNIIIDPADHERLQDTIPPIVALSFFSGAMGLDIGMKNGGIDALLACECNKACRMTIVQNNPEIGLIGDINKFTSDDILKMAKIPKEKKSILYLAVHHAKPLVPLENEKHLMMNAAIFF